LVYSALYQQKLVYLVLLDGFCSFDRLRRDLFVDDVPSLYRALRFLASRGLIYSHPVLFERNPRRVHFRKASSLSLEVLDRSLCALHWALTDVEDLVVGMSDEWYVESLRVFARSNFLSIFKADRLRGLFLD
jgi:hypothetical protein